MHEIEQLVNKLWNKIQTIPEECKGAENSANRRRYLKIRSAIHELVINNHITNHTND